MRRSYKKSEQEPLPPFSENLVFWAPLTEGPIDMIADSDYSEVGNVSYSEDGARCSNSHVNYFFENIKLTTPRSFYFEFKLNSVMNVYDYIVDFGFVLQTSNIHRFAIFTRKSDGRIGFDIGISGGIRDIEDYTELVLEVGRTYSVAAVFDVGSQVIYFDKCAVYNSSNTDIYATQLNEKVLVGTRVDENSMRGCNGFIRDLRIYNRALTAEEVAQL